MHITPTWKNAKHLLEKYDGSATEIFIVGLSLSQVPAVMDVLSELPTIKITTFVNETFEFPEAINSEWLFRLKAIPIKSCQHALLSASGTAQHLQIYLWIDVETATLEVELVFWNDLTFPNHLDTHEYEQRLQTLVLLAEACRQGTPEAQCILAPEHNGPIEELLERQNAYRVVW